jgi:tetratricopeptide (TPR) repeat protein
MKTFFAFFLLPALATGPFLDDRSILPNLTWPSLSFWPRSNQGSGKIRPRRVETQSYHSLMVNGARQYTAKNYALALSSYRRALAIRPDDVTALSGEAWSLYFLGQGEQAAKDFQAILKHDANDSWAREGMALCGSTLRRPVSTATAV